MVFVSPMAELEVIFIPTCLLCSKHLFGFVPHKLEYYTLHFFATFCYIMFMLKVCPYLLFKFLFSSFVNYTQLVSSMFISHPL